MTRKAFCERHYQGYVLAEGCPYCVDSNTKTAALPTAITDESSKPAFFQKVGQSFVVVKHTTGLLLNVQVGVLPAATTGCYWMQVYDNNLSSHAPLSNELIWESPALYHNTRLLTQAVFDFTPPLSVTNGILIAISSTKRQFGPPMSSCGSFFVKYK